MTSKTFLLVLALITIVHGKRRYGYYHQHQRSSSQLPQHIVNATHIYAVHHYFSSPNEVAKHFEVPDEITTDCEKNIDEVLCIPNSYLICLSNGTLLCVTDIQHVVSCGFEVPAGVTFKEECSSNCKPDQGTADVCMPCISNVTLVIKQYRGDKIIVRRNGLCVTVFAQPMLLTSTVHATLSLLYTTGRRLLQMLTFN